jgi:hypothetical protein
MAPPFERPRFFSGRLLTAEDLALEQDYFREKQKRHNRSLHGFGVVNGLRVTTGSGNLVIGPGMALDCEGNELVVETPLTIPLPTITETVAYVSLKFSEEPLPAGLQEALILRESLEVVFGRENFNSCHRHLRSRWLSCGKPHALTVARLKPSSGGWSIDKRYRAPVIK